MSSPQETFQASQDKDKQLQTLVCQLNPPLFLSQESNLGWCRQKEILSTPDKLLYNICMTT